MSSLQTAELSCGWAPHKQLNKVPLTQAAENCGNKNSKDDNLSCFYFVSKSYHFKESYYFEDNWNSHFFIICMESYDL